MDKTLRSSDLALCSGLHRAAPSSSRNWECTSSQSKEFFLLESGDYGLRERGFPGGTKAQSKAPSQKRRVLRTASLPHLPYGRLFQGTASWPPLRFPLA